MSDLDTARATYYSENDQKCILTGAKCERIGVDEPMCGSKGKFISFCPTWGSYRSYNQRTGTEPSTELQDWVADL